jgi:hypothetical protein
MDSGFCSVAIPEIVNQVTKNHARPGIDPLVNYFEALGDRGENGDPPLFP